VTARFGFPINLAVRDRRCVVVGGGEEAALRVLRLRDAGADLVLVTPSPCHEILELLDTRVEHRVRAWCPEDLDGAILVVATREDPLDAELLYAEGKARGALVNVLDDVERCDYAAMSQVVHGDFQLSIATNGRAPAVAKVVRERLEVAFGPDWGQLVAVVDEAKGVLGPRRVDFEEWARRWSAALADTDGLLARLRDGDRDGVCAHIVEVVRGDHGGEASAGGLPGPRGGTSCPSGPLPAMLTASTPVGDSCPAGRVHLVGAGPGDPDLLSVRAARLLGGADLVVHDQLVPAAVLALADPRAELVPAGRRLGHVVCTHDAVIERLADAARAGRRIVRLKGGDPVVFGRGAEEALELAQRGVATELVPGISSAVAAPELAGIPLNHRGMAAGFLVVTGQHATASIDRVDWELAARFSGTLVVLMGATRLRQFVGELQGFGRPASTPAAIVERAGHPQQRVVTGTLGDLAERAHAAGIGTPSVVIIGEVVTLRAATQQALAGAAVPQGVALATP
jgi:uroporphyrin-III C-methyltransferase / precorrin-2 dehydrogenase / sirohydrochlorin ferrochelatase